MLNKVRLLIGSKAKVLALGIANIVIGLCLSIYSSLSVDIKIMGFWFFRMLPIARFYTNVLYAFPARWRLACITRLSCMVGNSGLLKCLVDASNIKD